MSGRRILLVEPAYRSKYPPLGLMKISAYHKELGDEVSFVRGCDPDAAARFWDRIYIATMFSFECDVTVSTIKYYKGNLFGAAGRIVVGGIGSTIIPNEFFAETGIFPITGCLGAPGMPDPGVDLVVDDMIFDYPVGAVAYGVTYTDRRIVCATRRSALPEQAGAVGAHAGAVH